MNRRTSLILSQSYNKRDAITFFSGLWTNQFYPNGILSWMEQEDPPPQRRKFRRPKERRSRMIIRDVLREIQQMLRRNDSAFESLAERMESEASFIEKFRQRRG